MPFLPMKYPDYRLSMEPRLCASAVQCWFRQELERHGVDSLVYARYIISLLLQDDEDLEDLDFDLEAPCRHKRKGRRSMEKQRSQSASEERKKLAAVQCLTAVSDEKSGIATLVDELCSKLKDGEIHASASPVSKSRSCTCEDSDDSSVELKNPAQRYYAAFPALQGGTVSSGNPSPSSTVWRINPLVYKSQARTQSDEEALSASEEAEIRKITKPVAIPAAKEQKHKKSHSRSYRENWSRSNSKSQKDKSRSTGGSRNGKPSQKEHWKPQEFPIWPPGFAKLDPVILQNLDILDEDFVFISDYPIRQNDELCNRVESLLKGMLLPTPVKSYKDLQDVDEFPIPIEELHTSKKQLKDDEKPKPNVNNNTLTNNSKNSRSNLETETLFRDQNISPELKEQEIWYTQPIGAILTTEEEQMGNTHSKLRLYKRNSNPAFSPAVEEEHVSNINSASSSVASPVSEHSRSLSVTSNHSDDIFDRSVLIPDWLTQVISAGESKSEHDGDDANFQILPFKSSSPFLSESSTLDNYESSVFNENNFATYQTIWADHDNADNDHLHTLQSLSMDGSQDVCLLDSHEDTNTPTPVDSSDNPGENTVSVSLVDMDYMARFLDSSTPSWQSVTPDEGLEIANMPRRASINTYWQNQVLFDSSPDNADLEEVFWKPVLSIYDLLCWQPFGTSPYFQLWDVNIQKRNKVSPWGSLNCDGPALLRENTLIFLQNSDTESAFNEQNENTLIPRISIDIVSDADTDGSSFMEKDECDTEYCQPFQFFDRSVSMGDVPSLWEEGDHATKRANPKLSKSFELVPSEHSAFKDVPQRLLHVQSEPNLVQFRQDLIDDAQGYTSSPQEHLYFSPKTHFRPITPVHVPEAVCTRPKQQLCNDLFGGLPSTKTPYQQYHVADDIEDEEAFVPSFKLKNYSKSIQTGESLEKSESPVAKDVWESEQDRDTPENLTLSIIEDLMGEKLGAEKFLPICEDLDTANTDSAYETDYGCPQCFDPESDGLNNMRPRCTANEAEAVFYHHSKQNSGDGSCSDNGYLGDVADFRVESFMATFPHTQDWPDGQKSGAHQSIDAIWTDAPIESSAATWCHHLGKPEEGPETQFVGHAWSHQGKPDEGSETQFIGHESEADKYRNIWGTTGHEYLSVGIEMDSTAQSYCKYAEDEEYDNVPPCNTVYSQIYFENLAREGDLNCMQQALDVSAVPADDEEVEIVLPCGLVEVCGNGHASFLEVVDVAERSDEEVSSAADPDFFSVKLVHKNKMSDHQPKLSEQDKQSYGSFDLAPMPDDAVTLTDLEKEWLDPSFHALWKSRKPSSTQRKPCSFYLEGNCRRADCKFAHDISNITCRFWEEGLCFKGPLCPFLHGYARESSPLCDDLVTSERDLDRANFDLNNDEFPELSLTVKNMNGTVCHHKKLLKPSKAQNLRGVGQRDNKGRRGNNRRHSNKENRCEITVVDKCSSSI
ncbi:uncharacterized protein LOC127840949 isoform X1 [Dreissena polymorpha]|uniref:uncharacterized protein LOC127840949 isoform X1 n=1 Tax=Dreissena polymorpha TaxID=45954 RepID=UPI002264C224|nr:uncharacterized protein LOC127840949 isoform X1 [Dreissena polymorpha]